MPRNSSGTYTLPELPFVANTVIESAPMNSDLSDIATALTGSLALDGSSSMTGAIKAANGTVAAPSITFTNSLGTGWYRLSNNVIVYVANGVAAITYNADGSVDFEQAISFGNIPDAVPTRLDWYEEGTFTPVLSFGGASVGITYSVQQGEFTRIGNLVRFNIRITLTSAGSSVGQALVTGLPYTPGNFANALFFPFAGFDASIGAQNLMCTVDSVQVAIRFFQIVAGDAVEFDDTDFDDDATFTITGTYRV